MDGEGTAVEVWAIRLDGSVFFDGDAFQRTLSAAEQARAARMRAGPAREAFITTRIALRHILAGRLGMAAAQVPITLREGGKPVLDAATAGADLRFNVSHTRGIALCALAPGRELGVDVEWMDPALAWPAIAAAEFTAREQAALARLPQADQRRGFFAAWTRHEARLKGLGTGFSSAAAASADMDLPAQTWTLLELQAGPEHAAALALQGEAPCRLAYRLFSPPPMPMQTQTQSAA